MHQIPALRLQFRLLGRACPGVGGHSPSPAGRASAGPRQGGRSRAISAEGHLCAPSLAGVRRALGRRVAKVGVVRGRRPSTAGLEALRRVSGLCASGPQNRAAGPLRGPGSDSRLMMVVVRWVRVPSPAPGYTAQFSGPLFLGPPCFWGKRGSRAGLSRPPPLRLIRATALDAGGPARHWWLASGRAGGVKGGALQFALVLGTVHPTPGPGSVHPSCYCRHPEGSVCGVRARAQAQTEARPGPGWPAGQCAHSGVPQLGGPSLVTLR